MQGTGTYQGWDTPSYVIQVSPEDVNELRYALVCLRLLTQDENIRARKWKILLEQMDDGGFGFVRHETDVI